MEPLTLITTAITLLTPYLLKTGESVAEKIGEDIWQLIKKPFSEEDNYSIDIMNDEGKNKLLGLLLKEVNNNPVFKEDLENAVKKGQDELASYHQQTIVNKGKIEKQINIQNNSGNIQM